MKYIKENLKFLIFTIIICIIGGYFTTIYSLSYLDQSMLDEAIKQVGSKELVIVISIIQISIYAILFAALGIILSNKIGLWKKFTKDKQGLKIVIIISIIGGLLLSIFDYYIFGGLIPIVRSFYDEKPTLTYFISCFTYGGVFEEVLMRLFLMSLLAWIMIKLFYKDSKKIPVKVFVIANIISSLLFALGHLPSTTMLFGYLDFLIVFRCILLNGAFGLAFGYMYRKYGIIYSMFAHFGCHLISKIIWLLFI